MTTTPPEPPQGGAPGYGAPPPSYDPNAGYPPAPPGYGAPGGGMPAAAGQWAGPPLASWGLRFVAWLIDAIIAGVAGGIVGVASKPLGYLVQIGIMIYLLYMQGTTGQTIGKKVMNIKLLREADGQVVGVGLSIGRYFVHFLDAIPCLIGYLWPLWDAKRQTFADKILHTVVVKA
jgi:uncharacterized RDD family membrane protein YckC